MKAKSGTMFRKLKEKLKDPWSEISLTRKFLRVFFIFLLPLKILLLIFGVNFGVTWLIEELFYSDTIVKAMIGTCLGSC